MLIASRVLKTRDSIEIRAFKTRFTRFATPLMWTIFATWRFQTPTHTVSLSLSSTLSQSLKHSQSSNTKISQMLIVKRSPSSVCNENHPHHQTLSFFLRPHSDDPLTHTLKIPFVPTNGSSDFFKFECMFFL